MRSSFLLISPEPEAQWPSVVRRALRDWGELRVMPEAEALQATGKGRFELIIVDETGVSDTVSLVSDLWERQPKTRIVVATPVPIWQRAREVLKAGAADYIRKSQDDTEFRSCVRAVLDAPPPSWRAKRLRMEV